MKDRALTLFVSGGPACVVFFAGGADEDEAKRAAAAAAAAAFAAAFLDTEGSGLVVPSVAVVVGNGATDGTEPEGFLP